MIDKAAICERLVSDFGFTAEGARLRRGRCPQCGKAELWTTADQPWVLFCGRMKKCGAKIHVRPLYPDLFNLEKSAPPTKKDPDATARAFLISRGIQPERFAGWWKQETWKDKQGPFAGREMMTVVFSFDAEREGKAITGKNHRIISPPKGCEKTRTWPAYKGRVWQPPVDAAGKPWAPAGTVWVVEGAMDALSLHQAGLQAVSPFSCAHVAGAWLDSVASEKGLSLVIAFDNDPAGRKGARRWIAECGKRKIEAQPAFPPRGKDWNDLLLYGALEEKTLHETLTDARWRGALFLAETASEFYEAWKSRRPEYAAGMFAFNGEYYVVSGKNGDAPSFFRVSDFTMARRYRLRVDQDSATAEYSEVVLVTHREGEEHEVVLSGPQLAAPKSFREALFTRASVQWDGGAPELNRLLRKLRRRDVPSVRKIDTWGYDRPSGADFYHDGAHAPDGKWIPVNAEGFVTMGGKSYRLPAVLPGDEFVWLSALPGLDVPALIGMLRAAYPRLHALLALGFYTASLFADQLAGGDKDGEGEAARGLGMFPYLSLYGEPGTGKSTLLNKLACLLGRDWEGYPVADTNTRIGLARAISLYSNFPLVLTEADANPDIDLSKVINLRTAYNRGPVRIVGRKTNDNSITATPFRATLVFGWNDEAVPDDKVAARMVSFKFRQEDTSPASRDALNELQNIDTRILAGYRHMVMSRRVDMLAAIRAHIPAYSRWLLAEGVELDRTANNHALPLAGLHALLDAFLPDEHARAELLDKVCEYAKGAAHHKERSLKTDPDAVRHFLDQIDYLLGTNEPSLENMGREGLVAFSMVEAEKQAKFWGLQLRCDSSLLQRSVHYARHNYPHNSRRQQKQVKCWVFQREAFPGLVKNQTEIAT